MTTPIGKLWRLWLGTFAILAIGIFVIVVVAGSFNESVPFAGSGQRIEVTLTAMLAYAIGLWHGGRGSA